MRTRLLLTRVAFVAICTVAAIGDLSATEKQPRPADAIPIEAAIPAPDLWTSSIHLPKAIFASGEKIPLAITVENRGLVVAPGSAQNGYMVDVSLAMHIVNAPAHVHIVPTPYRFVEDMLLKNGRLSNTSDLQPGEPRQYPALVELPQMKHGNYYLTATVDAANRVHEQRSSNNQTTVRIQIQSPTPASTPPKLR